MSKYERVALGSLVSEYSERNKALACTDVYSVTNSDGFTPSTDYFSKEVFSKNISSYKVVRRGMFAYNPSRVNVGSISWLDCKDTVVISPMYVVFKIDESRLLQPYLDYYLHSDFGIVQIRGLTSGSVRDTLKYSALEQIKIPLPSPEVQRCIATVLDKVQSLIAARREQIAVLDKLAKDLFVNMFGDSLKNDNGWEVKTLEEISVVKIGPFGSLLHKDDYVVGGIPLVNPQHMVNGTITIDERFSIPESKHKEMFSYDLQENDIVLGRRGEIGRCAIVGKEHLPAICGTGSMIVRLKKWQAHQTYIHALFYQPCFMRELEEKATGSTMKNINAGIVKGLKIPLPPIELQQVYADRLMAIDCQKSRLTASHAELETLYQSLTERAFSGELFG